MRILFGNPCDPLLLPHSKTTPMLKILFLKGLPASGKSTYAKQRAHDHPERWVRINKDSIRKMLHDGKWSKGREKIVMQMHRAMAEDALKSGLSVIVDDTNLSPRHEQTFRQMAEKYGAEFELVMFDATVEECCKRDAGRPDSVGKDVILRMFYESMCEPAPQNIDGKPLAVICDIDGTLAFMKGRSAYEWDKVGTDTVNAPVATMLEALLQVGIHVLLVSGRDGGCRDVTEQWLRGNKISYEHLWMRPAGSMEKDTIVKRRIYEEHILGKYNILGVFDDRPCVVRFWRQVGLFVFDCGHGVEF